MSASAVTCGCCAGIGAETPLEVENRPGLSAIAYRVGVHSEFLASMVAGLTDGNRPGLAHLGTRASNDFTIALLDAWAVTADVLSFYAERLGQESYLRTARERISLQELGRLIGYRLRPGVAAQTYLAFALERPPDVPANMSPDPGSAPPATPSAVTLETGLRVQSIPGPGEQPQTFESVEELDAQPEWNALPASQTVVFVPAMGDTHAYFEGAKLNLNAGDALLFGGPDVVDEHWDFRIASTVDVDVDNDRTLVTWDEPLGSQEWDVTPANPPQPFVLRKRINVFGYNAPQWKAMSSTFRYDYRNGGSYAQWDDWPDFSIHASDVVGDVVDLEGSHPDLVATFDGDGAPTSWVVLSKTDYRELWQVQSVAELSRAEFALSGKVTRVTLAGGEPFATAPTPRDVTVFAVSEALTFAEAPDDSLVAENVVTVDDDPSGMKRGRLLLVSGTTEAGEDQAETVSLKEVQPLGSKWQLVLDGNLSTEYVRASVVVYGNVALATHGETVQQLLGSGSGSTPFQRFTLAHDPLTYVQSTDPSGGEAALDVRVNDVLWNDVPTLYGAARRDRAYAVRTDEEGKTYVQFGDGERGSRLPTGTNNVRTTYRKGLGAAGNVKSGALSQLLDRPLGVKGVSNPAAAAGGVDPEGEDAARASIPLAVRTIERAVSVLDYEDYALAFTGVAKAKAAVLTLGTGRAIVVTVAFEGGDRLDDLATSLRTHGDPRVQVVVLAGTTQPFRLALKVAVDPAYQADVVLSDVERALRTAYSVDARDFVQPVYRSEIDAVAHSVPGVLAVDVDLLYTGTTSSVADRLFAPQATVAADGTAIAAGLLVLDDAPLDWLQEMPT